MKKTLILIPFLLLLLALPMACAGSFHMDVSGSGNIGFFMFSSDDSGSIMQGYLGRGDVDYESTYSDGTLETDIDADGTGGFGTILIPENSWESDATYDDDGSTVSDFGSGTNPTLFLHGWGSSFSGGGFYKIN